MCLSIPGFALTKACIQLLTVVGLMKKIPLGVLKNSGPYLDLIFRQRGQQRVYRAERALSPASAHPHRQTH